MKKSKLIFCGLLLSVVLTGCGNKETSDERYAIYGGRKFLVISDVYRFDDKSVIYVDTETRVQYLNFDYGHFSGVSVLVDADGKPILYEGGV